MNSEFLLRALHRLSSKRPLFHSECDLQHELAFEIRNAIQIDSIRLERPFRLEGNSTFELDIFLESEGQKIGIELKYKTKIYKYTFQSEEFNLKSHAALGTARYDFIKDVYRLEQLKKAEYIDKGFAILLTNDTALYSDDTSRSNRYRDLYLNNGRLLTGAIGWREGVETVNTVGKERLKDIQLSGTYKLNWREYSNLPDCNLKMVVIEVD